VPHPFRGKAISSSSTHGPDETPKTVRLRSNSLWLAKRITNRFHALHLHFGIEKRKMSQLKKRKLRTVATRAGENKPGQHRDARVSKSSGVVIGGSGTNVMLWRVSMAAPAYGYAL
jgi:hypothetical protein